MVMYEASVLNYSGYTLTFNGQDIFYIVVIKWLYNGYKTRDI